MKFQYEQNTHQRWVLSAKSTSITIITFTVKKKKEKSNTQKQQGGHFTKVVIYTDTQAKTIVFNRQPKILPDPKQTVEAHFINGI